MVSGSLSLRWDSGKVCAFLSPAQLDAMPSIQLVFGAEPSRPLLVRYARKGAPTLWTSAVL